jgi:hypothetical protein
MAQTNYTPISLYYSTTASAVPTAANLVPGELAINTNDGKLYYEDSSGVVQVLATKGGVGTSSNTQVLYNSSGLVVGSAGLTYDGTNLTTTGTATATRFIPSGSTVATNGMYLPAANTLGFSTNSTERMRITSTGLVGIGTSSPINSLTATNGITISGAYSTLIATSVLTMDYSAGFARYTSLGADASTPGGHAFFGYSSNTGVGAERMRIDSSGRLLVGTTSTTCGGNTISAGGVNIEASANFATGITTPTGNQFAMLFANGSNGIVGSISLTSTLTAYNVTSDERLKTNIVDAPLGNIDSIKVRSFDWVINGSHQEYGMVAQELIEVAPYAVTKTENPDDMMQVDYSKLVPMMIKEIQDLKQRIATLENK